MNPAVVLRSSVMLYPVIKPEFAMARASVFPYDDQGTYDIATDCTGSAFFPNDDEPFKLIFVDSKTIVLGVVSTDLPGRHGIATLRRRER
jgi:hypothetical protein